MVTKLRNEIMKFEQKPHESLFEAWERYKLSIDRCPNHNMLLVTQIDTFYNGLTLSHRDTINVAAGETFMQKAPKECYELIKNMTAHHNHWDTSAIRDETSRNISFTSITESSLPSNTVPNPRADLKAITTRSGITLTGPSVSPSSKAVDQEPETITDQALTESTNNVPPLVVQPSLASTSFYIISSSKMPEVTNVTPPNLGGSGMLNIRGRRTVALTTEDMQKRKNDVKARTTLLLALPDEHQLRFSKYKTAQELWDAILKTFGGNEATKKTKKNLLKQQYGNFKVEGSETMEQTFNRLQPYSGNEEVNTASIPTASTYVSCASANIRAASISQDTTFWKKTGKKISIQGTGMAGFDKSKVKCFDCHKMGHFARECRAPRSQDRGRRDNYRQGSKVEEQAPKALMAIDGVGWDWSFMENEKENHALVTDEEAPTKFALMAKTSVECEKKKMVKSSSSSKNEACCSKSCKKNTDNLNSKITELSEKFGDSENMLYHYKLGPSQVEGRLVEFKNQEIKFCKKIKGLEFKVECRTDRIKILAKELKELKKEKEGLDSKLTGFQSASKDLDNLLESQRSDKNKEGLGYSAVPPPPAQVYSPPKKDMSWTGLLEFADDTITDYSRPSPAIESNSDDLQNKNPSATETGSSSSTILSKPAIKFVKAADRPTEIKTNKVETVKKHAAKYAEMKSSPRNNYTHKCMPPRPATHRPYRPPMRTNRPNMNDAQPKRTSVYKPAHSYVSRHVQRKLTVRTQSRVSRVSTVCCCCSKQVNTARPKAVINRRNWVNDVKASAWTKRSRGKEVVDYILQVKIKFLIKKLEDSESEHQV
uniref:Reverse transcriptase domain-containing protein n=1 Tax=Tanacetum cinerariifolium TaxID=118510 RepID=A0A6L2N8Q8_TANCI|nr:reverse transcriptase domain-containing protein [Tanacetum cinerariifolium]